MKIQMQLKFFPSSQSDAARQKVLVRLHKYLKLNFPEDEIKNEEFCFFLEFQHLSWAGTILHSIRACQKIGNNWNVTGNIDFEFNGCSNNPKVVGIDSLNAVINNPDFYKNNY